MEMSSETANHCFSNEIFQDPINRTITKKFNQKLDEDRKINVRSLPMQKILAG